MNLYHALQTLLDKVNERVTDAQYGKTEKEMLSAVLENQVRLGESVLIIGSLLHAIAGRDILVEVNAAKGQSKH